MEACQWSLVWYNSLNQWKRATQLQNKLGIGQLYDRAIVYTFSKMLQHKIGWLKDALIITGLTSRHFICCKNLVSIAGIYEMS